MNRRRIDTTRQISTYPIDPIQPSRQGLLDVNQRVADSFL